MQLKQLQNQPFFYILVVIVLVLSYLVLKSFFAVIVLAFLAALFFRPMYNWLFEKFRQRKKWATFVSVVIVVILVLIPLIFITGLTVNQIIQFTQDLGSENQISYSGLADSVNNLLDIVPGNDYTVTEASVNDWVQQGVKAVGNFFLERLPDIGSGAFQFLTFIIIFVIVLYALFPLQDKLLDFAKSLSPMDDRIDTIYITRVIEMSKSMVKGTFLIAVIQGIVSGIFLTIAGVDYVLFLTILMIFLGVIPIIGSGFVVVPIGIIMLFTGNIWQGVFLILANVLIIGNIDNYLRPKVVSKQAELHPALIILGVIGGLQVFGVLGFIYGPVIMILLVTTIEMYMKYIRHIDNSF